MMLLKTAAALLVAGLSILPLQAAEAQLLEQTADSGVKQIVGTLDWKETLDASGAPGLAATVAIADSDITAEVTLVKNDDPSLPATHLVTVTFTPGAAFEGKSVVQLAGVMMRKGEAMQGTPLPGAAAMIVSNQFLFAPGGPAPSGTTLAGSTWMDFALVFETGQRALLALSIDDTAKAALTEMAL